MSKSKLSLLFFVVFVVTALVLPGCITYNIETKISADGSGERSLDVALDESFANLMKSSASGEGDIELQLKKGAPKNAKFKTFTKEGKVHYKVTFPFKNIDELKKTTKEMSAGKKEGQTPKATDINLEKRDLFVFASYKFSENFPASESAKEQEEMEELSKAFSVNYKLTLPGRITKASTKDIKGDTATWNFNLTEGKKVEASSRLIRWWLVIVLAVVILGIVVIIMGMLIFIRKPRSRPRPRGEKEQPAQPEM